MGYRSQVIVAVETNLYKINKELIDRLTSDCDTRRSTKEVIYFTWDWVKWYDTYPEVIELQEFINSNEKQSALARMGEDADDFDFLNDPESFDIHYKRELSIEA